jgi:hypothetical protein
MRVKLRVPTLADGYCVAQLFTLLANLGRKPPYSRMEEEQRFSGDLHEVCHVVVAPDMGQLVGDDRFNLLRWQSAQRAYRQQQDREEPADGCRSG